MIDARGSGWTKVAVVVSAWRVLCGCETRVLDLDDPVPPLDATGVVLGLNEDDVSDAPRSELACADGVSLVDGSLPVPAEPLNLSVDIVDGDAGGDAVVPGLSIIECGRFDFDCFAPQPAALLPGALPPHYRLDVPFQWWDTLRLSAPGYVDTRYAVDGALRTSRSADVIEMFRITTIERLWAALGEEPDSDRGLLFVRVIDCNGNRVPGASVESMGRDGVESFHLVDGEVVRGGATSDDDGVIGFSALAGYLMVEGFVQCSNGELPRNRATVSYRLHALGATPAVPSSATDVPVCDANDEALIGAAAVVVNEHAITIGELRPGL